MTFEELERRIPTLPGLTSAFSCTHCVLTNARTEEYYSLINNTHLCAVFLYLIKSMNTVPSEDFEVSFTCSLDNKSDDSKPIKIFSYDNVELFHSDHQNVEHQNVISYYKKNITNAIPQQKGWYIFSIQDTSSTSQSAHDFVQRLKFFNDLPQITYN